jgi:tetratricopeptide (TPR) repeat protein
MSASRRRGKPERPKRGPSSPAGRDRIVVRRAPGGTAFELAYPACVDERKEDMEEVRAMLDAGEVDVAVDELRWLLEDCPALLEAHQLLGEVALADGDLSLARGHLGYAFELGMAAIPPGGLPGPLPCAREANRPFFEAGRGLAWCLKQAGEDRAAAEVVEKLLVLDPTDPLNLRGIV